MNLNIPQNASKNQASVKQSVKFVPVIPCPVCSRDHDGDCRVSINDSNFILCHTYQDAKIGTRINGYCCVREANGHTASFIPYKPIDKNLSEEENQKYKLIYEKIKAKKAKAANEVRQAKIEKELTVDIRNKLYYFVLSKLELSDYHKEKLLNRGYTEEQIINEGFKTVKRDQWISDELPANLAGFKNGCIATFGDGLAYPVKTPQGQIVGLYYQPDDPSRGKYKPLSSPSNPVHINGEIPLAFHSKNLGSKKISELWLVEGHGHKDKLAKCKHGIDVLSAMGGQFVASPENFKTYLADVCEDKAILNLCPDGGDCHSKPGFERWKKTAKFAQELGYKVQVAWWSQYKKKENPDIDELENLSTVEFISLEQFEEIHKEEYAKFEAEKKLAEKLAKFSQLFSSWKHSRKYTPTHTVDLKDFEFNTKGCWIPDVNCVVAVKSGLGTNKTGAMIKMMVQSQSQRGAIIIGYRNNLLYQTISRALIEGIGIAHIQKDEEARLRLGDDFSIIAGCLDSIKRLEKDIDGKDLYLDETCSVLLHGLSGGTLGNEQAKALAILTKALRVCNRVFLLDGNLADIHVNFISKLCPDKKVLKILNKQNIVSHEITFVEGIDIDGEVKKRDKSPLVKALLDSDCVPFIASDSKDFTIVLDKLLKDLGKTGIILNAETVGEAWAKEFLEDPNKYIEKHKPRYVIISPTAESGVSITINDYFTHKFSFFVGVLGTNSQHQMMFRSRDNKMPHYVFCPEKSFVRDRNNPHTYYQETFKNILEERFLQSANLAGEEATAFLDKAIQNRHQDEWWNLSCQLGILDNFEMDNLRTCLIHALEEAGHNVKIEQWDIEEYTNDALKEAKIFVNRKKAKELFTAQEFSSRKEADEAAKKNPRVETQRKIEKTFLLDKLPGIKYNDVWNEDFIYECHVKNKHFIDQQYNYWLLKNYEISQKRHESDWYYAVSSEFFFKGRVKKMKHDKIWALHELDILKFEGKEYHKNHAEVIETIKKLRERRDIQVALNMQIKPETVDGKERLEILSNLLNLVGLKNTATGQKNTENKVKIWHYTCVPIGTPGKKTLEDNYNFITAREAILEAIEQKMKKWLEGEESKVNWESVNEEWKPDKPIDESVLTLEQLQEEWNKYKETDWLKRKNIVETAGIIMDCRESEQIEDLKQIIPDFCLKAALSCLHENQIERLSQIGLPKVQKGAYGDWMNSFSS